MGRAIPSTLRGLEISLNSCEFSYKNVSTKSLFLPRCKPVHLTRAIAAEDLFSRDDHVRPDVGFGESIDACQFQIRL